MEKIVTINDVSEALGIPASTLRYWDKQGLLRFERNNDNNYRQFSFQTMVDICDIMLFRDLEIPIYTLKKIGEMSVEDLLKLFSETKGNLEQTIIHLRKVINRINMREKTLKKLQTLKAQELSVKQVQLKPIRYFDFADKELVQLYLNDPNQSADILKSGESKSYTCGIFVDTESDSVMRKGDDEKKSYLYGLMWMNQEGLTNSQTLLEIARSLEYQTGDIICQYLVSAKEDEQGHCDYFEAWIEIK